MSAVHSGRYGSFFRLRRKRTERRLPRAVAGFDVQGVRSLKQKAALLSGGNAQKLVIAGVLPRPAAGAGAQPQPRPRRSATAAVHARLRAAREAGAAVLVISEDLDEVLALADRIGVMSGGRIVAEFDRPADRRAISSAMVSHDEPGHAEPVAEGASHE